MKSAKLTDALPVAQGGSRPFNPSLAVVEASGARHDWLDTELSTAHGNVAVRQTLSQGLPVLMLHDVSSSKRAFEAQMMGQLGAEYRLIAIDLPGHGGSDDASYPSQTYTIEGYAEVAIEVMEQLGIDDVVLVGWSLGGRVALELATCFPGVVGIMLSGLPLETAMVNSSSVGQGSERVDPRVRSALLEDVSIHAAFDPMSLEESDISLAAVDGADSFSVTIGSAAQVDSTKLWGGRHHLIPRAGNAPFLEQPDLFNQVLRRFLRDMDLRRAESFPSLWYSG
jgi:pimeloyl-ACP methyl ester carboxylesterase